MIPAQRSILASLRQRPATTAGLESRAIDLQVTPSQIAPIAAGLAQDGYLHRDKGGVWSVTRLGRDALNGGES